MELSDILCRSKCFIITPNNFSISVLTHLYIILDLFIIWWFCNIIKQRIWTVNTYLLMECVAPRARPILSVTLLDSIHKQTVRPTRSYSSYWPVSQLTL